MMPLSQYCTDRRALNEEAFITRHSTPVLVHRLAGQGAEALSFRTTMGDPADIAERLTLGRALRLLYSPSSQEGTLVVFPVAKRGRSCFAGSIHVGRSRGLDIFLPFGKVSKMHAYFAPVPGGPDAGGPASAAARYTLTD